MVASGLWVGCLHSEVVDGTEAVDGSTYVYVRPALQYTRWPYIKPWHIVAYVLLLIGLPSTISSLVQLTRADVRLKFHHFYSCRVHIIEQHEKYTRPPIS